MNQPTNNQPSDKMPIKEKIVIAIHMIILLVESIVLIELGQTFEAEPTERLMWIILVVFTLLGFTLLSCMSYIVHQVPNN